jgi:D-alanyl-D-alanine carboxypeptidase (penicillin-binding protein 5/6)
MKDPTFRKIVATYTHKIEKTPQHKEYNLLNETNLLTTYPGVRGVKTGFTDEAGLCLITYLDYDGHQIVAVLLNSQNRRAEMAELLDYSLQELGITPPKRQ